MNVSKFLDSLDAETLRTIHNKAVMEPNRSVTLHVFSSNPDVGTGTVVASLMSRVLEREKLPNLEFRAGDLVSPYPSWWDEPKLEDRPAFDGFVAEYRFGLGEWCMTPTRFPNAPYGCHLGAALHEQAHYDGMSYMYDGSELPTPKAGLTLQSGKPVLVSPLEGHGYLVDYIGEPLLVISHYITNFVAIRMY